MSGYNNNKQGFAMVTALLLLVILAALLASYFALTSIEISTENSSRSSTTAFYAAEAGLNVRAKKVREIFEGFNFPFGTSPTGYQDCLTGNTGSGDFACSQKTFSGHKVLTYVVDETQNDPKSILIPPGERFAGLSAQEYVYTTYSTSLDKQGLPESILALRFKNRLVPIFQFMAFYNKDLEFGPGNFMQAVGPVHANGDLYLDVANSGVILEILDSISVSKYDPSLPASQVTSGYDGGNLYRGSKLNSGGCLDGVSVVTVAQDSASLHPLDCNAASPRRLVSESELTATWPETISVGNDFIEVPPPSSFLVGEEYWDLSDLRIVFDVSGSNIEVRSETDTANTGLSNTLNLCPFSQDPTTAFSADTVTPGVVNTGPVTVSANFPERREGTNAVPQDYTLINVDIQALLDCIDKDKSLLNLGPAGGFVGLADDTHGGLVFYITVDVGNKNGYGVRFYNGASLSSVDANLQGLTLVTDLPVYLQGDFNLGQEGDANESNWRPAAIFADSFNVLSNGWHDTHGILICAEGGATLDTTEANVAVISGTSTTGNREGSGGWNSTVYGGGVHNYPRYHEDWASTGFNSSSCPTAQTFSYRGSFVSLNESIIASGEWLCCGSDGYYYPPIRDYGFDQRFKNPANLPPITPNVVYLTQELFERSFDESGFN